MRTYTPTEVVHNTSYLDVSTPSSSVNLTCIYHPYNIQSRSQKMHFCIHSFNLFSTRYQHACLNNFVARLINIVVIAMLSSILLCVTSCNKIVENNFVVLMQYIIVQHFFDDKPKHSEFPNNFNDLNARNLCV